MLEVEFVAEVEAAVEVAEGIFKEGFKGEVGFEVVFTGEKEVEREGEVVMEGEIGANCCRRNTDSFNIPVGAFLINVTKPSTVPLVLPFTA